MKESTQEKYILKQSIKFLQKDSKFFFLAAFIVITAMFLIQLLFSALAKLNPAFDHFFNVGSIESINLAMCFVGGLISVKECFYFFSLNQVPKTIMRKAYILEGLAFCFISALAMALYCFLIILLGARLGLPSISHLPIHPGSSFPLLMRDLGKTFLYLLPAFNLVYFFGLLLATINYRLKALGRAIFWTLFGLFSLNAFIGVMEVMIEGALLEDLSLPLYLISKPFIRLFYFINEGMGQFLLLSLIILVIFIVLWAFLFQDMQIKYTKVDE